MRTLSVSVKPASKRSEVIETAPNTFKVYVTAPAQKGKANLLMIKQLAEFLQIPPSRLLIKRGDRARSKTVIVLEQD